MHPYFGTTSVTSCLTTPSLIHTWKLFIVTVMKIYRATPVECFNVCGFTCNRRGALGGSMGFIMAVIMATSGCVQLILKPSLGTTLQCDWNNKWFKLTALRGVHWRNFVFHKLQQRLYQ